MGIEATVQTVFDVVLTTTSVLSGQRATIDSKFLQNHCVFQNHEDRLQACLDQ